VNKWPAALGRPAKIAAWPEELVDPLLAYAVGIDSSKSSAVLPGSSPRAVPKAISPRKAAIFRHPLTGANVPIKLNQSRESVLQRTATPVSTQTVAGPADKHIVDLYLEADSQGLVTLILVGYGPAEKADYIAVKRIPGTTTLNDASPLIEELIDAYRRALSSERNRK
jgi:hypothetical protein